MGEGHLAPVKTRLSQQSKESSGDMVDQKQDHRVSSRVEFRVLGPLEVLVDGKAIPLGGAKQRSVLAMLLCEANRVVSAEKMAAVIWDEDMDEKARGVLQVHVSNLRKALTPAAAASGGKDLIATKAPGYQLTAAESELDLLCFEADLKKARSAFIGGNAIRASGLYNSALDLWRGTPLADLQHEPFAQRTAMRLNTLRIQAIEGRLEADLAAGRHAELIGELQSRVEDHPLNEQFVSLLMLALYRSGRQADALRVFRECRDRLGDELGLDPRQSLRELESRILAQDPRLDPPRENETDLSLPTLLPSSARLLRAVLVVNGSTVSLDQKVTSIGRRKDRDILLEDLQASRDHADVVREAAGFRLIDRGSSNGTKVNGVTIQQALLSDGDEILIGETVLRFSVVG
jgi:SARP family transcriptional regulator, regulator of embCAB operon